VYIFLFNTNALRLHIRTYKMKYVFIVALRLFFFYYNMIDKSQLLG